MWSTILTGLLILAGIAYYPAAADGLPVDAGAPRLALMNGSVVQIVPNPNGHITVTYVKPRIGLLPFGATRHGVAGRAVAGRPPGSDGVWQQSLRVHSLPGRRQYQPRRGVDLGRASPLDRCELSDRRLGVEFQ
jgi:hypothetical protein